MTATGIAGSHPDLDRWIAYRGGETGDDTEDLQDHLAGCRECTNLVLDLAAFADPAAATGGSPVSEFDRATAWRALKPRLAPARSWALPAALAASFVAVVVGAAGWWQQQRELDGLRLQIADLSRPQANVPVHDLYLGTLRSSAPDTAIEIPAGARTVTLILNELEARDEDELRAVILDASGQVSATVEGLELDVLGVVTLGLSRGTVDSGEYVVRVEALRGGKWVVIADYALELRFR